MCAINVNHKTVNRYNHDPKYACRITHLSWKFDRISRSDLHVQPSTFLHYFTILKERRKLLVGVYKEWKEQSCNKKSTN